VAERIRSLTQIFVELREVEAKHRLNTVTKPEPGFAWPIYLWVEGKPLNRILHAADMSAGDFVRTSRRLIDVLEQVASVTASETKAAALEAVAAIRRGIVDTDDANEV
jgi:ATP-dependent RNA helicase HelY